MSMYYHKQPIYSKLDLMDTSEEKQSKKMSLFAQHYPAYVSHYNSTCVYITFMILGILFLAGGIVIATSAMNVYEERIVYDGKNSENVDCHILQNNEKKYCNVTFVIDRDIDVPLYLYYELTNFHQNHRQYVESKCMDQLVGKEAPLKKQEQECKYKLMNSMNTKRLNPCGLIANSLFNDVFTLTNDNYSVCERDITRPVDRQLFHNPPNYGEEGEYQWIYETYSNIHKDKSEDPNSSAYYGGGIEDEHFIVWMKNSAFPNFRKMYGRIESSMQKNTQLTFTIENNILCPSLDTLHFLH